MSEENLPKAEMNSVNSKDATASVSLKRERKKRYVKYSPLSLVLLGICSFVFCFSILGLFEQSIFDYAGQAGANGSAGGGMVFLPAPGGSESDLVPSPTGTHAQWQEIAAYLIKKDTLPFLHPVAFDTLKKQNKQTVAWMYWPTTTDVKGLPFNMAVVQASDNDYYLTHSFDNSYNANGWIYADYRCNMKDIKSNKNTIIYGHARSYLMFGGLRFLNTKTKWQMDGYNHFIYINTPTERTVWQIFSWYETTTEFNYIKTEFLTDLHYIQFLNTLQSKNTVPAFEKFSFSENTRILTLSTCKGVNSDARVAMHAVLVKYEKITDEDPFPDDNITTDSAGTNSSQSGTSSGTTTDTSVSTDLTTDSDTGTDGTVTDTGSSTDSPTTDSSSATDVPSTDSSSDSDPPSTEDSSETPSDDPVTDNTDSDSTDSDSADSDSTDPEDSPETDLPSTDDSSPDVSTDTDSSENVSSDSTEDVLPDESLS